ncbi:RipA family octameric membrane protein [Streptomyces sp. NPDC002547]
MSIPSSDDSKYTVEIYKLAVEMADRTSARRATANSYFLTAETALLSVAGLVGAYGPDGGWWADATIAMAGLALSISWWMLLGSYRRLSSAKFKVINRIEKSLPERPFSEEWDILDGGESGEEKRRRYIRLGVVEKVVPSVYGAIFVILFVGNRFH